MPLKRGGAEGASGEQVEVMSPEKRAAARADIVKSIGHELKLDSVKDVTDFERDFFAERRKGWENGRAHQRGEDQRG